MSLNFKDTSEIKISDKISESIIGQDQALTIIKKAAKQRRNVLLIGDSGTGKSLTGQALAELLPKEKLVDIISYNNPEDDSNPIIKTLPKGEAKNIVTRLRFQTRSSLKNQNIVFIILAILAVLTPWWILKYYGEIMAAAALISSMIFIAALAILFNLNKRMKTSAQIPKILVDNSQNQKAPFLDATGAQTDALLGTVLHDPLQSGGLGTPAYERVIPGMIHKANKGVLFCDEIGNLSPSSQQELLTAMQEKKYPITCRSERSSGAVIVTTPAPTDFVLVAAGTLDTIKNMHTALRSRIRGYGYEVYMNTTMDDNPENENKIARFVSQEVHKDKKIPHFTKDAVIEIIREARKRSGTSGKLSLRLRELGGLIRAAGDLALENKSKLTEKIHVLNAKTLARTLEQQIADKYIIEKKKYEVFITKGTRVGRVNGLAVLGDEGSFSGIILPIEAEVTPGGKKSEIIATGQLGNIAKEAVQNVSAIILKYFGEDIKEKCDIYVQFLQTASTGVEGDSASIAVATAIISAFKKIPVKQDTALTGSLSIRGEVLAIGGITQKVEAAIEAGIAQVIIPKTNEKDIILPNNKLKKIKIIPVSNIQEVLKHALDWKNNSHIYKKLIKR